MTMRLRPILSLALILGMVQWTSAGERWWVYLTEKPAVHAGVQDHQYVSPRSLARRAMVITANTLLDWQDTPVHTAYIEQIRLTGASIRATSRILNAVSVEAEPAVLEAIRRLPFVRDMQPVRTGRRTPEQLFPVSPQSLPKMNASAGLDYGPSLTHHQSLNSIPLHEIGVIGHGVFVGMIDDGFNSYRTHDALRSISVVAAYDFIQRDTTVSIMPGEHASQGFHGAATLSVLAGFDEGHLIGPAYGATLALAKTEVGGSETIIEEDYYVEGLEWLDSLGVDIISSSLGYIDWYTQSQLDGQTAITTKIAKTLAARGVLLVTAMGNEGNYRPGTTTSGTMIAPADADSILSVGAVNPSGFLTSFSSTGPTADGRTKPDVVTQGSSNFVADWTNPSGYYLSQGTSFSTPLTAAAAALVLSAHPDATAMQVRDAMRNTAIRFNDGTSKTLGYPNDFYGWGHIDVYAAALSLGPLVSNIPLVRFAVIGNEPSLIVTVRAASATVLDLTRFALFARRTSDTSYVRYPLAPDTESGLYSARIPVNGPSDTSFVGYLTFADQSGPEHRRPLGTNVFELQPTSDSIASLYPPVSGGGVPDDFSLKQNFPNPFNAGTTIQFLAPRAGYAEVSVYNILGQRIRTLFAGAATAGTNTVTWPRATDDAGRDLPSGVYLIRLSTVEGQHMRKMMLLK